MVKMRHLLCLCSDFGGSQDIRRLSCSVSAWPGLCAVWLCPAHSLPGRSGQGQALEPAYWWPQASGRLSAEECLSPPGPCLFQKCLGVQRTTLHPGSHCPLLNRSRWSKPRFPPEGKVKGGAVGQRSGFWQPRVWSPGQLSSLVCPVLTGSNQNSRMVAGGFKTASCICSLALLGNPPCHLKG